MTNKGSRGHKAHWQSEERCCAVRDNDKQTSTKQGQMLCQAKSIKKEKKEKTALREKRTVTGMTLCTEVRNRVICRPVSRRLSNKKGAKVRTRRPFSWTYKNVRNVFQTKTIKIKSTRCGLQAQAAHRRSMALIRIMPPTSADHRHHHQ